MIFFANAEGTITQSINTPVNQGSNGANEVVLICPFSATAITARYILPNGEITRPYLMDKCSPEGNGLYAYRALLDGAVTRKSGTVTAQFTLWIDGTQLPTVSTSFFVNKGVPNISEYDGKDATLEDILNYLSELEKEIAYNVIKEYNLGENNDKGEYQIVFAPNGKKEAPAVYNNYKITYGDYEGKTGTLFVFSKTVDDSSYTIQSEILFADNKVYTRRIDIGEEVEDGSWFCDSVDQSLDKDSTRSVANKVVTKKFNELEEQLNKIDAKEVNKLKEQLNKLDGEMPIVIDEVLNLTGVSLETFENNYTNSIDEGSLNRIPKAGDKAIGLAQVKGGAIYSFLAEFKGGVNDDGFCEFRVKEQWLIHQPLDVEISLTSRNPVENKAVAERFGEFEASLDEVREIAQGKQTGYVFDTKADMETSLSNADFVAKLKAGDDLFIKAENEPDYWWTGTEALPKESKVDLVDFYTKEEIDERRSVRNITHLDTIYETETELPLVAENGTTVVVGSKGVFSLWAYYTGITGESVGWKYKYPVQASTIYCVLKKNGENYNKLVRYTMAKPYFLELSSTKVEQIVAEGTPIAKVVVDGEETIIYEPQDKVTLDTPQTITGEKYFKVGNAEGLENLVMYANDSFICKPLHIKVGGSNTDNIDCENDYTNFWKTTTFLGQTKIDFNDSGAPNLVANADNTTFSKRVVVLAPLDANGLIFAGGQELRFGGDYLNITDNTNEHNTIIQVNKDYVNFEKIATFKSALNVDGLIYAGGKEIRFPEYVVFTDNTNEHNVIIKVNPDNVEFEKTATFKQNVNINVQPTQAQHAVRKDYVDNAIANAITKVLNTEI